MDGVCCQRCAVQTQVALFVELCPQCPRLTPPALDLSSTTYYLLLTTYYLLPTTTYYYLRPTNYYSLLPATYFLLPTT